MAARNIKKDLNTLNNILFHQGKLFGVDFRLYPFTNEDILKYYNYKDLNDKNALCITGSADHALFATLAGAKNIVSVDINPLAKYFSALKIAMIKTYDKKYFSKQLTCDGFGRKLKIKDLKLFLSDEEYEFWNKASKILKKHNKVLFRTDGNPKWSFDNLYDEIKEKLFEVSILYYDCNVTELSNKYENYFDAIFLSNCLEWSSYSNRLFCLRRTDEIKKEEERFLTKVSNFLDKDGVIYDVRLNTGYYHEENIVQIMLDSSNRGKQWCNVYNRRFFK